MLGTCCSLFPTRSSPLQITQTPLKSSDEKPNVYFASLIAFKDICRESEICMFGMIGMFGKCPAFSSSKYAIVQNRFSPYAQQPSDILNLLPYKFYVFIKFHVYIENDSESTTNSFSKWNDTLNTSIFRFYIDESRNELSEWHVLLQALSSKCTIRTK